MRELLGLREGEGYNTTGREVGLGECCNSMGGLRGCLREGYNVSDGV